jgi:hypothetical protein
MPLAIWTGSWRERSIEIEVEVFGEFQPPKARRSKLGKFKYRYRLFADCECLSEELRLGHVEDLVVLRGRVETDEHTAVGVRAILKWDLAEVTPEADTVNTIFGPSLVCSVSIGGESIPLEQVGNTRRGGERKPEV